MRFGRDDDRPWLRVVWIDGEEDECYLDDFFGKYGDWERKEQSGRKFRFLVNQQKAREEWKGKGKVGTIEELVEKYGVEGEEEENGVMRGDGREELKGIGEEKGRGGDGRGAGRYGGFHRQWAMATLLTARGCFLMERSSPMVSGT